MLVHQRVIWWFHRIGIAHKSSKSWPWLRIETPMVTWGSPILGNPHIHIDRRLFIEGFKHLSQGYHFFYRWVIFHTHIYIYICVYTYIYMCVCIHIYIYIYIYMCIHIYIYICVCIYIYVILYRKKCQRVLTGLQGILHPGLRPLKTCPSSAVKFPLLQCWIGHPKQKNHQTITKQSPKNR